MFYFYWFLYHFLFILLNLSLYFSYLAGEVYQDEGLSSIAMIIQRVIIYVLVGVAVLIAVTDLLPLHWLKKCFSKILLRGNRILGANNRTQALKRKIAKKNGIFFQFKALGMFFDRLILSFCKIFYKWEQIFCNNL